MSVGYRVLHRTEYRYAHPVQTARHLLHLAPRACPWQRVIEHRVVTTPEVDRRVEDVDAFGNPILRIELTHPHSVLRLDGESLLEISPRPWAGKVSEGDSISWEAVRAALTYGADAVDEGLHEALAMRFESPLVRVKRELADFASPSLMPGRPLMAAARDLMGRIHRDFAYDPAATEVGTSVLDVLEHRRGVCQDFAHLMIGALRASGLAARYVSGYLRTDPPPGKPRLVGADASHAWVAVFVPEIGWVEFDPTNDCLADTRYLVLGWGRDFSDVSPVRGVIQGGGRHSLAVGVTVTPTDEAPQVEK